ncbi:MAG: hypothetical protein JWN29_3024 [Acidimicrobiales bacterium]|nr:hypothetical protein [Acidimicrobiales bacterium]
MSDGQRRVIVNADDFGRTPAVNRGIVRAHTDGIVRSTSLMVRAAHAGQAVELSRPLTRLEVGLHVDLTDWAYRNGEWLEVVRIADVDDPGAVAAEVASQIDAFVALMGRPPTHLDSHQHVHRHEPVRSVVLGWGERLGVRVRELTPGIAFCGNFYGQYGGAATCHELITVDALVRLLDSLPPEATELSCHPGEWPDPEADDYGIERAIELETLCDPKVKAHFAKVGAP